MVKIQVRAPQFLQLVTKIRTSSSFLERLALKFQIANPSIFALKLHLSFLIERSGEEWRGIEES